MPLQNRGGFLAALRCRAGGGKEELKVSPPCLPGTCQSRGGVKRKKREDGALCCRRCWKTMIWEEGQSWPVFAKSVADDLPLCCSKPRESCAGILIPKPLCAAGSYKELKPFPRHLTHACPKCVLGSQFNNLPPARLPFSLPPRVLVLKA